MITTKMFFVALLIKPQLHVIIPKDWVFGIDDHWEKFVNASINRNQIFLCFYSEEARAIDDHERPNVDFPPDFGLSKKVVFPETGCYDANLIWYRGN